MKTSVSPRIPLLRSRRRFRGPVLAALVALMVTVPFAGSAHAAATEVPLATAADFSVLAGAAVTNTGTTTVGGSVGVHPGTAIDESTMVIGGTVHSADAVALQAKSDLTTAYNNAAGQTPPIAADPELGGETLVGGVYNRAAAMALTGVLTLDGQNDPDSVWVFQAGSTLTTAPASSVVLINGARPVQRVLAGRQLRDDRHHHHVRRQHHGRPEHRDADRRDASGSSPGPDRRGHPGQQRDHHSRLPHRRRRRSGAGPGPGPGGPGGPRRWPRQRYWRSRWPRWPRWSGRSRWSWRSRRARRSRWSRAGRSTPVTPVLRRVPEAFLLRCSSPWRCRSWVASPWPQRGDADTRDEWSPTPQPVQKASLGGCGGGDRRDSGRRGDHLRDGRRRSRGS